MSYADFLLDKRVVNRNIARGLVDPKAYKKEIAQLSDSADNAQACGPADLEEAEGATDSEE